MADNPAILNRHPRSYDPPVLPKPVNQISFQIAGEGSAVHLANDLKIRREFFANYHAQG